MNMLSFIKLPHYPSISLLLSYFILINDLFYPFRIINNTKSDCTNIYFEYWGLSFGELITATDEEEWIRPSNEQLGIIKAKP